MTVHPDLILRDVTVITMDDARTTAGGLWLRGDRVAGVGEPDQLKWEAGRHAEVVSLGGATIVPGMIDAHAHISSLAYMLSAADCYQPGCPDIPTMQARMREQAAKTPVGAWVTGNGYLEYKLAENRHPTRWELDAAVPDRPAVVYHTSGHACVVNSAGLRAMGFTDDSADPPGGVLGRDDRGRCDGVVFEQPMFDLADRNFETDVAAVGPAGRAEMMAAACRHYASLGLTSCSDAGASANGTAFQMFLDAEAAGGLSIRITAMINEGIGDYLITSGISGRFGNEWLEIGGIKIFADGGMSSRTAAVDEPYPVPPYGTGVLFRERAELAGVIRRFHEAGFQVGIHAQGDRAIRTTLEAYEDVIGRGSGNPLRHRIEHGGALYPKLIEQAAAVGIHVASQPGFLSILGDGFLDAFGDDNGQLLYPFASIRKAGLVVGGSSDNPVITESPLVGIRDAVVRRTEGGRTIGANERLTALEALEIYTRGSAFITHSEGVKGSLEPGKYADYVVLAENPLEVDPERIAEIKVLRTVVGGRVAFEA